MMQCGNRKFFGFSSQPGGIDHQVWQRQLPEFLEALPPGMEINRIVENQCTAWLVNMKTTHAMDIVDEQMSVRQMSQVIRTLPDLDDVGKACNELHQVRRLVLDMFRDMENDAQAASAIGLKESDQRLKPGRFFQSQSREVAVKDQNLSSGLAQNRIAGVPIVGFTGQQGVG